MRSGDDHRTKRYAVVSCHVERPLDDRTWKRFSAFQRRGPGGFRIAALLRPPDRAAAEDEAVWLERAREAAARGPLGHHTHWTGPGHARPTEGDPARRVREEAEWMRSRGLHPRFFCGGGWYMDAAVAATLAELGYTDCTATAFAPAYLPSDAPRLSLGAPAWIDLPAGRLLELPATHSLGMAVRGVHRRLPRIVHVYFHDTDLLHPARAASLFAALAILARRRPPSDLERLANDIAIGAPVVGYERVKGLSGK